MAISDIFDDLSPEISMEIDGAKEIIERLNKIERKLDLIIGQGNMINNDCPKCGGSGQEDGFNCSLCFGTGEYNEKQGTY